MNFIYFTLFVGSIFTTGFSSVRADFFHDSLYRVRMIAEGMGISSDSYPKFIQHPEFDKVFSMSTINENGTIGGFITKRKKKQILVKIPADLPPILKDGIKYLLDIVVSMSYCRLDNAAFTGCIVDLYEFGDLKFLQKIPWLESLEEDFRVKSKLKLPTVTQRNVINWGLPKINQLNYGGKEGEFTFNLTGKGVDIYVVDSGIYPDHQEFIGRVKQGFSVFPKDSALADCSGHGSHCAGIAAGYRVGVAKEANIIPVRVLDCKGDGDASGVIKALNWILERWRRLKHPSVINMSLGGPHSRSVNAAVDKIVAYGITVVTAAGNENSNACTSSPGSAKGSINVGATTKDDKRASYSNFGPCVDIMAPGHSIASSIPGGKERYAYQSGTSMASPHVAGIIAQYLQKYPSAKPRDVRKALLKHSSPNQLTGLNGEPNLLVQSW